MNQIIDYLESSQLFHHNKVNIRKILSFSLKDFNEFGEKIDSLTKNKRISNNTFVLSASPDLGGSGFDCNSINCRKKEINNLARFATLYSDQVLIENFLINYKDIDDNSLLEYAQNGLIEDLEVILSVKEIINSGYIDFFKIKRDWCFACQAEEFLGVNSSSYFYKSYENIKNDFLKNMDVTAQIDSIMNEFTYNCSGSNPYFKHDMVLSMPLKSMPEYFKKKVFLDKLIKGNKIKLNKSQIKKHEINLHYAHNVASSAMTGIMTSAVLKTPFLTENDLHIQFINKMNCDINVSKRNKIVFDHLSTMVPFIEEVELKKLSKLRNRESDSFILFRKSLNDSINEIVKQKNSFTVDDAKALYSDIISPSLTSLNAKLNKSKKDLISKPTRSVIGIAGVISFGIFTNIVPTDIVPFANALGLVKFGTDFIKDSIAIRDSIDSIKNENMYYLWKIKNINKSNYSA